MRLHQGVTVLTVWLLASYLARAQDVSDANICRDLLRAADVELGSARKNGDAGEIERAAAELKKAADSARSCPVAVALYRANLAQSRCDGEASQRAYLEYKRATDAENATAVNERVRELQAWVRTTLRVEYLGAAPVRGAALHVVCHWLDDAAAGEPSACAVSTAQPTVEIARPANATCKFELIAPGYEPQRGEFGPEPVVSIAATPTQVATTPPKKLEAQEPPPAPPPDNTRLSTPEVHDDTRRPAPYVLGAVGVGALATGAVFGGLALSTFHTAQKLCPEMQREVGCDSQAVEKSRTALLDANVSNISFAVGVVSLGVAAYLWFSGEGQASHARDTTRVDISVDGQRGELRWRGAF